MKFRIDGTVIKVFLNNTIMGESPHIHYPIGVDVMCRVEKRNGRYWKIAWDGLDGLVHRGTVMVLSVFNAS